MYLIHFHLENVNPAAPVFECQQQTSLEKYLSNMNNFVYFNKQIVESAAPLQPSTG